MLNILSILLGSILCILAMPIIFLISAILLAAQGRPLFYKGLRLGKFGKEFYIYKFRTMILDAETKLHGQVVGYKSDLKTPVGKFLRASRLDELPQLWNLAKGDMAFFGPRPMRESVYATMGNTPHYKERLNFVPGLFGPTQVLLPHSAPKTIRFRFLRRFYQNSHVNLKLIGIFLSAMWALLIKILKMAYSQSVLRLKLKEREHRNEFRTCGYGAGLYAIISCGELEYLGCIQDANTDTLSIATSRDLSIGDQIPAVITVFDQSKDAVRWRATHCDISIERKQSERSTNCYLLKYTPKNVYHRYVIDKLLLKRTIC